MKKMEVIMLANFMKTIKTKLDNIMMLAKIKNFYRYTIKVFK